jgi:catechol 2,3-dioxygenase-like lactoylglutathione lyase family enzyme
MPDAEHANLPEPSHSTILASSNVATGLPATDLARARRFYSEKIGLGPAEQRPGGLLYRGASGCFALFESAGSASGTHTQMAWEVDDIEAAVALLRKRGVVLRSTTCQG